MRRKGRYLNIFLFLCLIGAIILLLLPDNNTRYKEIVIKDTIIVRDTIKIQSVATRFRYKDRIIQKNDTIYITEKDTCSFVACLDTTIQRTSVSVCYAHPERQFDLQIATKPDTIKTNIYIKQQEKRKDAWYVDALKIGGGVVLGFLLRSLR